MTSLLCSVQISREQVHEDKYLMFQSTNERRYEEKRKTREIACHENYRLLRIMFFLKEWLPEKLMTLGYVLMIREEKFVAVKSYDKDREK